MDKYPKVEEVTPKEDKELLVSFEDGSKKIYDCKPLLGLEVFERIEEDWLFKSVRADAGGCGISWDEDLDLSESELWEHGRDAEPASRADG